MPGLPKSFIKKYGVSKKAWREYRKSMGAKRDSKTTRKPNPRRVKKMAKKKRSRRYTMTIPIAPIIGLGVGLAEPLSNAIFKGEWDTSLNHLGAIYTGYNAMAGEFQPDMLKKGLFPLILGALVHKFVGGPPLNVNRMLARAKVPFIRI